MEVSSNAPAGKRLSGSQPQFSLQSDSQPESPFELLLAMPTTGAAIKRGDEFESPEYTNDYCSTSCQDPVDKQPESDITEDTEPEVDEASSDTTASAAVINVVASQQIQRVEQPVEQANEEVVTEGVAEAELPETALTAVNAGQETVSAEEQVVLAPVKQQDEVSTESGDAEESIQAAKSAAQLTPNVVKPQGKKQGSDADRPERQSTDLGTQNLETDNLEKATQVGTSKQGKVQTGSQEEPGEAVRSEGPQPVSTRKNQQRERPARWYEKESSGTSKVIEPSNPRLTEGLEAGLNNPMDKAAEENTQSNTETSHQQTSFQQEMLAEGTSLSDAGLAMNNTSPSSAFGSGSTTSATLNNPSSVSVDSSAEGNAETARSISAGSERVQSKAIAGGAGTIESSQTGTQVDISRAEKVRLVQRVARSFSRMGPSGGNVQIKLHPPELGALAVQVRIEGKSMSARLTTESQAAREVIMESLPQLRSRLAEQGYDVVQFTVEVASDSSALGSESGAGQGGGQEAAGQGGFAGNSADNQERSNSSSELRRSNFLRRQADAGIRPQRSSFRWAGTGVDIQA
jgi:flagellar hook-length control protein FliK